MNELKLSLVLSVVLSMGFSAYAAPQKKPIQGKVIYGDDNRRDVFQVPEADVREMADSTVAMIPNRDIKSNGSDLVKLSLSPYGVTYGLCKDEPFYSQSTAAMCSGFLVGEDLIATAGHCINADTCSSNSFVFGFRTDSQGETPEDISKDEVYKCKAVLARELTGAQDYALVRLDRPVKDHRVLKLKSAESEAGDEVLVIGHPTGLPTKVTDKAVVREVKKGFFVTNLDTYGGNSGSAVFDQASKEIVGILVRGETDYTYDSEMSCLRSHVCAADFCRGEDVTQISYLKKALSQLGL